MMNTAKPAAILNAIKKLDHFLVSAHVNADGDAIASVLAIHMFLQKLGKKSLMVLHDQKIDGRFNYFEQFDQIVSYDKSIQLPFEFESAIVLDAPGYKRLGDVAELIPEELNIIKIDHHPLEDKMGNLEWIDVNASSTTAMVYEIIALSEVEIDIEIAKAIFTGIVYDTGRFSFSNTTARDFAIGSKMVELGVKPSEITNRVFFENSFGALKTIGKGLFSLENHLNGMVNIIYLDYEDMNTNNHHEIEELANYSVAIRGGEVGLFIREIKPAFHKVSFRSRGIVDVNVVAKAFDGGGHARAAGCRIEGDKATVIGNLLSEINKQI